MSGSPWEAGTSLHLGPKEIGFVLKDTNSDVWYLLESAMNNETQYEFSGEMGTVGGLYMPRNQIPMYDTTTPVAECSFTFTVHPESELRAKFTERLKGRRVKSLRILPTKCNYMYRCFEGHVVSMVVAAHPVEWRYQWFGVPAHHWDIGEHISSTISSAFPGFPDA